MTQLTVVQYFGPWVKHPDATDARKDNACVLVDPVNRLIARYEAETGRRIKINPATGSIISGQQFGGFRPQSCPQGAPDSSHKQGQGVDIYDPDNALDDWLTDAILTDAGLYREHPDSTQHWCHLTTRAPHSGRRTFLP